MNQVLSKVSFQIDITSRLKFARALTNAYEKRIDLTLHVRSQRLHLVPLRAELDSTFLTVVRAVARL